MINLVLAIGIMMMAGLFGGLLAQRFKFPVITGYIVVGILLSPSLLNIIPQATIDRLEVFVPVALGFIAYSIGSSLHLDSIRKLEKGIAWITPLQAVGAWLLTTLAVILAAPFILSTTEVNFLSTVLPLALITGAIATATAPAAVLALTREYRARGPLTAMLLSVVAIDDAIAIIVFSIATGISKPLAGIASSPSWYEMLALPVLEILGAIVLGAVLAFALIYAVKLVRSHSLVLVLTLGTIMLCVGIAHILEISEILANMSLGFVAVNRARRSELFSTISSVEDVVFAIFFVLAGLHFDITAIESAGLLGLFVFLARFGGKYLGAGAGARLAGSPDEVRKYLGFALLPAAGVSLGLALLAKSTFPGFGTLLFNAVLASVIISALAAPLLGKLAIFKAGEQWQLEDEPSETT